MGTVPTMLSLLSGLPLMPTALTGFGVSGVRVPKLRFLGCIVVLADRLLLVLGLFLVGVLCRSGDASLEAVVVVLLVSCIRLVMGMMLMWRRLSALSTPPALLYCLAGVGSSRWLFFLRGSVRTLEHEHGVLANWGQKFESKSHLSLRTAARHIMWSFLQFIML